MDEYVIETLQKQLREKDKQIAKLMHIIDNLTQEDEDNDDDIEVMSTEPKRIGFWERHMSLSYVVFFTVVVLNIAVMFSPAFLDSYWERLGDAYLSIYGDSLVIFIGLGVITWFNTPPGRKWLNT